jgi:hypothetical protein
LASGCLRNPIFNARGGVPGHPFLTPKTYHKEIQNQKWEEKKQIKRKSILNSFLKKGRKGRKYHISVFTGHNQWLFPRPKLLNFSLALPV